ncbi:nitric oxide reductase activation protein NorD [Noviherbaspirillum denitrificans]|uniref:Nitric oxide reductase n=1 Tax=Noviherbaspirillum denitrificans TaxID=1968433 RepID=A0A254TCU4_9BURK|nr:VWA domain-containing protein [Noviherbaspirillum denitrificans]OWW20469.1 nitric oxide reductase [Noviherbaspirillum denitrificans]
MEEFVGGLWDKLITRTAYRGFPKARVELKDMEKIAPVFFRALGGDAGLNIRSGTATTHGGRRSWMERVAGIGEKTELAWTDDTTLHLPASIDLYPEQALNRELYLWLIALAAHDVAPDEAWIVRNQQAARATLEALPGMQGRYSRLVEAELARRIVPAKLPKDEADAEQAIRDALFNPGSVTEFTPGQRAPFPVPLWLHPEPPQAQGERRKAGHAEPQQPEGGKVTKDEEARKRSAENVDMPKPDSPFVLLFRAESLFSWAEYVKVNRSLDEDDNDDAAQAANDLDVLSVANDGKTTASRIRFDLDLPAEADDDHVLADGILLPEWDYRKRQLQPAHCRLQMLLARDAQACDLPVELRPTARHLRSQFQALVSQRARLRAQASGSDLDLDACVRFAAEKASGMPTAEPGLYIDSRKQQRDLSCLLLADLSLSTDAWINNDARVIDVIRDSMMLFGEALGATGDRFALYGFSSVRRENVRCHLLKGFDERYGSEVRGRLAAMKPGFYTRMGAAIRHSAAILSKQKSSRKLLLILTDGKPNDLDKYEGRYGIEDTRVAVQEARRMGLTPFCVTIDDKAGEYLPHLFGANGYVVVRDAQTLPKVLPGLYVQLTGEG